MRQHGLEIRVAVIRGSTKRLLAKIAIPLVLLGFPGGALAGGGFKELAEADDEAAGTIQADNLDPGPLLTPGLAALGIAMIELNKAIKDYADERHREQQQPLSVEEKQRLRVLIARIRRLAQDPRLPFDDEDRGEILYAMDTVEEFIGQWEHTPEEWQALRMYVEELVPYAEELERYRR